MCEGDRHLFLVFKFAAFKTQFSCGWKLPSFSQAMWLSCAEWEQCMAQELHLLMLYNVLKTGVIAILLYVIAIGIFAGEKYVQEALQGQHNSLNSQMLFPCELQGWAAKHLLVM